MLAVLLRSHWDFMGANNSMRQGVTQTNPLPSSVRQTRAVRDRHQPRRQTVHAPAPFLQLLWTVWHCNCVKVSEEVQQLGARWGGVLQLHPLLQRAKVVPQVRHSSGLDTRHDPHHTLHELTRQTGTQNREQRMGAQRRQSTTARNRIPCHKSRTGEEHARPTHATLISLSVY